MERCLNRKYKLAHSYNHEAALEAFGAKGLLAKAVRLVTPELELREKDGEYTIIIRTLFKNVYETFRSGEEYEYKSFYGEVFRAVSTVDKNVINQIYRNDKTDKTVVFCKVFTPEEINITIKVDGVVAVRIYKAVDK